MFSCGMTRASFTTRGSAVRIPGTSFQRKTARAERARARSAAVRSDPPRPRVATRPSGAAPRNPATTGTPPLRSRGTSARRTLRSVSCRSGEAPPNRPSGTMRSRLRRCKPRSECPHRELRSPSGQRVERRGAQVLKEDGSPREERKLPEGSGDFVLELVPDRPGRDDTREAAAVSLREELRDLFDPAFRLPPYGPGRLEQRVGHAGQRRHDDDPGPRGPADEGGGGLHPPPVR